MFYMFGRKKELKVPIYTVSMLHRSFEPIDLIAVDATLDNFKATNYKELFRKMSEIAEEIGADAVIGVQIQPLHASQTVAYAFGTAIRYTDK